DRQGSWDGPPSGPPAPPPRTSARSRGSSRRAMRASRSRGAGRTHATKARRHGDPVVPWTWSPCSKVGGEEGDRALEAQSGGRLVVDLGSILVEECVLRPGVVVELEEPPSFPKLGLEARHV